LKLSDIFRRHLHTIDEQGETTIVAVPARFPFELVGVPIPFI